MDKAIKAQEELNESLINMMCMTFNKQKMKQLLATYIKTNELTNELTALKKETK